MWLRAGGLRVRRAGEGDREEDKFVGQRAGALRPSVTCAAMRKIRSGRTSTMATARPSSSNWPGALLRVVCTISHALSLSLSRLSLSRLSLCRDARAAGCGVGRVLAGRAGAGDDCG
jgi:hypothetical protein